MMAPVSLRPLPSLRIPGRPDQPLTLNGAPLSIIDESTFDQKSDATPAAIGVASVLHNWCPSALFALLDVENWFSLTWILTLEDGTKIEIGRIRNRVTMGRLGKDDCWTLMLSFDVEALGDDLFGGPWIANTKESMLGDENIKRAAEIEALAAGFAKDLLVEKRWLTGKNMRHEFFVESPSIGMDPWDDGLRMNPHWLYECLHLSKCTVCKSTAAAAADGGGKALNRCGRCGTASYCSGSCQERDWPVHKGVCAMSMEDRGKAIHYTQHGGLVGWRGEKAVDAETSGEVLAD